MLNLLKIKENVEKREAARQDPMIQQVFFLLGNYGYLTYYNYHPQGRADAPVTVNSLLMAAEIELRVWEVLPAFVYQHTDLIEDSENLPQDLKTILHCIHANHHQLPIFHDISPQKYMHWLK